MRVGRQADRDLESIYATGLSSGEGLIERIRDIEGPEDKGGTNDKRLLVVEQEMARVMAASSWRWIDSLSDLARCVGGALAVVHDQEGHQGKRVAHRSYRKCHSG